MNKKDMFEKNLELTTEFSRYILEHPEVAKSIPPEAIIAILPQYDQKLSEENLKIAKERREKNQPMILVKVKKLAPARKSRLYRARVKLPMFFIVAKAQI